MKPRVSFPLLLLPALLFLTGSTKPLRAQASKEFKADMRLSGGSLPMNIDAKIFSGDKKLRMEINLMGLEQVMIMDLAKSEASLIMPAMRSYMSFTGGGSLPLPAPRIQAMDSADPCASTPRTSCRKIGPEAVNGYETEKWEFADGESKMTAWVSSSLGLPVKTEVAGLVTIELSNIVEGKQSDDLFTVPEGYQKIEMGDV